MFKRAMMVLVIVSVIAASCWAQPADVEVVYSGMIPQILVWEDVVLDEHGHPLLEGDTITYEVFVRHSATENEGSLGITDTTEATVDLSTLPRGYYYVGVRSIGETEEGAIEYSDIAWSNDPVAVDPTLPFAYLVTGYLFPARPTGLRTVP